MKAYEDQTVLSTIIKHQIMEYLHTSVTRNIEAVLEAHGGPLNLLSPTGDRTPLSLLKTNIKMTLPLTITVTDIGVTPLERYVWKINVQVKLLNDYLSTPSGNLSGCKLKPK